MNRTSSINTTMNKDHLWLYNSWTKLRYFPWRFFYVDYDVLKHDTDSKKHQEEWTKVNDFYMLKRGEIERRIEYYKILMVKQDNPIPQSTLKFMLIEIHHLYHFINLNQTALNLHKDQFSSLLHLAFEINQLVIHDKALYYFPEFSHVVSTNTKTHKYWVHPDNLMEIVLFLATKSTLASGSTVYKAHCQVGNQKKSDTHSPARLTTLYFDTPRLETYKQLCTSQQEPVAVSRIRWAENSSAMVEEKCYQRNKHEWVQKRLWMKSKHVQPWLEGEYSLENVFSKPNCEYTVDGSVVMDSQQIKAIQETCLSLQKDVNSKQKVPVMKVEQSRLHFILDNSSITVSIDYDIVMNCLITQETTNFPYCVFQISFDSDDTTEETEWVHFLSQFDMLKPVEGFSIYAHGVATLSNQKVQPSWINETCTRFCHSRGQLVEDEPPKDVYMKASLVNRKSIDSITTTATDASSSSNTTQPTIHSTTVKHYCSFDHPTSSNSDPTNCKSCMAKLTIPERNTRFDRLYSPIFRRPRPNDQDITTFGALLLKTFLPRRFRSFEKEPLMSPTYRQYRTFSDQELGKLAKETMPAFSRAAILTSLCIILSSCILYIFYILASTDFFDSS